MPSFDDLKKRYAKGHPPTAPKPDFFDQLTRGFYVALGINESYNLSKNKTSDPGHIKIDFGDTNTDRKAIVAMAFKAEEQPGAHGLWLVTFSILSVRGIPDITDTLSIEPQSLRSAERYASFYEKATEAIGQALDQMPNSPT